MNGKSIYQKQKIFFEKWGDCSHQMAKSISVPAIRAISLVVMESSLVPDRVDHRDNISYRVVADVSGATIRIDRFDQSINEVIVLRNVLLRSNFQEFRDQVLILLA